MLHHFVDDMEQMTNALGKSLLTQDASTQKLELADIWHFASKADSDLGSASLSLPPFHHLHQFLHNIEDTSHHAMATDETRKQVIVTNQTLAKQYSEAKSLTLDAIRFEERSMATPAASISTGAANKPSTDIGVSSVFQGLEGLDKSAEPMVNTTTIASDLFDGQGVISARAAKNKLAAWLNVLPDNSWTVSKTSHGTRTPLFIVEGKLAHDSIRGVVSEEGAHVMSFEVMNTSPGMDKLDLPSAERNAKTWLHHHGFASVELNDAMTGKDYVALLTYVPIIDGAPVIGSNILIKVSLENGKISGFNATSYYEHHVDSVPQRRFTVQKLSQTLSPSFHVEETRQVVQQNDVGKFVPAVAFYGNSFGETYVVIMDATTGRQLAVNSLTSSL